MKKEISIDGMSCQHCVNHVTEAIKKLAGVISVNVDLGQKKATVEGEAQNDALTAAVTDAGYTVTGIQ